MRFRTFIEPQEGATYDDQLALALLGEELGFDAFFRSDHYINFFKRDGTPGPTDAWTTLAGLARDTSTIRLGTLVSPVTFRPPGPLAITVAQIDAMSAGRVELGLGAGWNDREHAAYGLPFPGTRERFDMLAEQLEVITGLWGTDVGARFTHLGHHYTLTDSPALPKPVQRPHPPIVIGGSGPTRTPALAARFASEFNVAFAPLAQFAERVAVVRAACEAIGRDPASLRFSIASTTVCGVDDTEVDRRAAAIGRTRDHLAAGIAGTPAQVIDQVGAYRDAGADTVYFQLLDIPDLDHVRLLAAEVLPAFA
ncbi:MAG TPA: LLM class F420-dependent oxidoreductase [Acidimicrobiia bacterium]|nr:LLM class F420-dependent oxidoreductase [Acidimicrobiia bacterium]